jgi:uncharacterized protein YdaU (DUF1376 family)
MPRDTTPPAFMFYPDDFASDGKVEAMSTEGIGCYILLLCKAWRENPPATIPADDRVLARWTRVSDDRWIALRAEVLSPFEPCGDGRLVQKRLRSEYEKQRRNRRVRSASGKLGASVRWQTHGTHDGEAMTEESESDGVPELFERFWSAFPSGRKKSKARARESFEKAIRCCDPQKIITAAAEYAASDEGRGPYVKMPSTWLNGECWTDDRSAWKTLNPKSGQTPFLE